MNFIFVLLNICLWIFLVVVAGYVVYLVIKALRKYTRSVPVRKEKAENAKTLGEVLKQHRLNCKMTQEFVAETLGVSRQAVSKWESGVSVPNINTLILISEKFDIPVDEMLKSGDVVEKIDNNKTPFKKDRNYSIVFLIIGILGLISIPFWAEWKQKKNMELFKTAYEHSYDYIFEYPLSIILILALMFIGLGIYFISKKKKGRRFDEKND